MREELVLSLFPGVDLFGEAFRRMGFCVVRGPELLMSQDIRDWNAIAGKFDVVIGGPPCKLYSPAANWNEENKNENLIPEFERIIHEALPIAFVMENVIEAPLPKATGYAIQDFVLNSHDYGANQKRKRRFTFGYRSLDLGSFPFYPDEPIPMSLRTRDPFPTVLASEAKYPTNCAGRHIGRRLTLREVCELQGFPELADAYCFQRRGKQGNRRTFRKETEYELIGNGVELNVGLVIARTIARGFDMIHNSELYSVTSQTRKLC